MSTSRTGSRWWKFDFHTHTPHSTDTHHWRKAQGTDDEVTAEKWLRAHAEAGIHCVAVTDHNGAGWLASLQSELRSLKASEPDLFGELTLFPGVEISVNGGDHVLAIFDVDTTESRVERLLGAIGVQGTSGDPVPRSDRSMLDVAKAIYEADGLCIPAHVDANNGYFRQGADGKLANDYETVLNLLRSGWLAAVEVRSPNWTPPKVFGDADVSLAMVRGTDCHSLRNFGSPGTVFTWIKMGTPSLEGLRLALMDTSDFSVLRSDQVENDFNPNETAGTFIESVEVRNLRVMGDRVPQIAYFSPWMTSLVGGRGTGKSTLLDCMRIVFGRVSDLVPDLAAEFDEFFSLPKKEGDDGVLTDESEFVVIVRRETGRYRLTWSTETSGTTIEREDEDGHWTPSEGDVYQRFPIRILTQKEIYHVASDPTALIELIDSSPTLRLNDWREAYAQKVAELRRLRSAVRERKTKAAAKRRLAGELAELNAKIKLFEKGENQKVLARYQKLGRQERSFNEAGEQFTELATEIDRVASDWDDSTLDVTAFDPEVDSRPLESFARAEAELARTVKGLRELATGLREYRQRWMNELEQSAWGKSRAEAVADYEALSRRLAEAGLSDLSQYGSLLQQRTLINKQLEQIAAAEAESLDLHRQWTAGLGDLARMHCERSKRRKEFLEEVLAGNEFVRARVLSFGLRSQDFQTHFRDAIGLGRERFENDILSREGDRGLLVKLYDSLPADEGERQSVILERLENLKKDCEAMSEGQPSVDECSERLAKYLQKLEPERIDELWHLFPNDLIEFEYRKDPSSDSWERLERGSPGQKTAALLAFLLSHGSEPIILDQPEDDLDNHLIYDLVVHQIRQTKSHRQIIIATHNPNIVVNGDAEKVLAMAVRHERCVVQDERSGCLQDAAVREEVCTVMEGGRDAFLRRYQRMIPPNNRGQSQ